MCRSKANSRYISRSLSFRTWLTHSFPQAGHWPSLSLFRLFRSLRPEVRGHWIPWTARKASGQALAHPQSAHRHSPFDTPAHRSFPGSARRWPRGRGRGPQAVDSHEDYPRRTTPQEAFCQPLCTGCRLAKWSVRPRAPGAPQLRRLSRGASQVTEGKRSRAAKLSFPPIHVEMDSST